MAPLKEITTPDEWHKHVASLPANTLLIAYFYAPWAAPCAQMRSVLETLQDEHAKQGLPEASWVAINAEELSDISETYDVVAVPYIILQRGDKVLETISGNNANFVRSSIEKHSPRPNGETPKPAPAAEPANVAQPLVEENPEDELRARLEGLVKAAPVMLFMKGTPSAPQCGFSRQIVNILRDRSVKYGFFNILADDDIRQGLKKYADWPTYPQLWVEGELVGGLDIVKEELANDPDFLKKFSVPKESKEEDAAAA
ncbi:glutaredoxin [Hypoxylon sp. FL0543]|nr:glutaredoxin [Hypoxylon sp. FL0543]